jgi:hypothetical protein
MRHRHHPFSKAVLILAVSFVNLAGAFLAVLSLGGLGEWSDWQFVGLFGLIEAGMGFAFVVGPNIWRLPAAEANTDARTKVRLAPDVLLVPQWGAVPKIVAGLLMLAAAAWQEGWSPWSLGILPVMFLLAFAVLGLSLVLARAGVARPDLDVFAVTVRRPRREDLALPSISIGGLFIQLITQIGVFPLVKLAPPALLYRPELAPSGGLLATTALTAGVLMVLAWLLWRGRIGWRAPCAQQAELEQELSAQ